MYAFFQGSRNVSPALNKKLIEYDLMETFHWSHKQIRETPVKKIQEIMLIKRVKGQVQQVKMNIEKVKAQSMSSGSSKRSYREV